MTKYDRVRCVQCEASAPTNLQKIGHTEKQNIYWAGWYCDFCLSFQPEHVKKKQAEIMKKLDDGYWKQNRLTELRAASQGTR